MFDGERFGVGAGRPAADRSAGAVGARTDQRSSLIVLEHRWKDVAGRDRELVHQDDQRLGVGEDVALRVPGRLVAVQLQTARGKRRGASAALTIGSLEFTQYLLVHRDDERVARAHSRFERRVNGVETIDGDPHLLAEEEERLRNEVGRRGQHVAATAGVPHDVHDQSVGVLLEKRDFGLQLQQRTGGRREVR